nr:hypothetical protein [Tanacetum cinerariifolium]
MSKDVARSYDGDGGGEDRPPQHYVPTDCGVASLIETQFDLRPHMESPDWTEIHAGIQQHLQKAYNTNKAAFKAHLWKSSTTQEYPSLIDTFFVAQTVSGEFLQDEDKRIYEMRRLEATCTYNDDEINRLARRDMFSQFKAGGASGSGGCGDDEESTDDQDNEDENGDGDT